MPEATMKERVRAVVAGQLGIASYYLKMDEIEGESIQRGHEKEIEVASFGWGNSISAAGGDAGARGSGRVNFQDLQIVAAGSKAGPRLMLHCATGQHIKRAILTGRLGISERQQLDYLKITLDNVTVTSYSSTASSGDGAASLDHATLQFGRVEVEYKVIKADGTVAETIKVAFDLGKNAGIEASL